MCRGLVMPDSQAWLGVFSKALLSTIYPYNYEQLDEADLTPEAAAAEAYERYTAWLAAECGGGSCVLPSGGKVYRKSPSTGHFEYLEDGAWVEDTDIPPAPTREEPTEAERLCLAAANAENVLHLLFDDVLEMWEDEVLPEVAAVDFWTTAGLLIGTYFYPPLAAVLALEEIAFDVFYKAMDVLTEDMWDADFTDLMVCLFQQNATEDEDEVIHFDQAAILDQLFTRAFVGETYLLQAAQVAYLVGVIGQQGLDHAGATTAIEDHTCTCGSWCFESSDFSMWQRMRGGSLQNGVGPVRRTVGNADYGHGGVYGGNSANYAEYKLQVNTSASTITDFRVLFGDVNAANFSFVPTLGIGLPGQADDAPVFWWPANYAVDVWNGLTGLSVQNWRTEFYLAFAMTVSEANGQGGAKKWQVRGTGINPFLTWNDEGCSYP